MFYDLPTIYTLFYTVMINWQIHNRLCKISNNLKGILIDILSINVFWKKYKNKLYSS